VTALAAETRTSPRLLLLRQVEAVKLSCEFGCVNLAYEIVDNPGATID
jgi:hypothetical protein